MPLFLAIVAFATLSQALDPIPHQGDRGVQSKRHPGLAE